MAVGSNQPPAITIIKTCIAAILIAISADSLVPFQKIFSMPCSVIIHTALYYMKNKTILKKVLVAHLSVITPFPYHIFGSVWLDVYVLLELGHIVPSKYFCFE
jgi:hypothetical protein